ncbi:lipopolysaccharide heptosyltransferase II [candidate division LCP-89 bacterium B3_LCP]|uniref:lipopolysaccharide heptosyltransferase II n=1 Tax=candidate division LCP-89 bacterium B3_LCP TaxID=2012998 RepID=A0A532V3G9_UNCL8|nr:MAG: lipopolysaccharide heptosyltransferase II [candidate division LCP-89 bacterium B3_LCP]
MFISGCITNWIVKSHELYLSSNRLSKVPVDSPASVLVVQTAFIGDVVLALCLVQSVKEAWPQSEIDVMVRPPSDDLLKNHTAIRDVIVYDKQGKQRGFQHFFQLANQLKENHYDIAFIPHRSFRSGILCFMAAIPARVGFGRGGGRLFHTKLVEFPEYLHEIERNLRLLTAVTPVGSPVLPRIFSDQQDIKLVDNLIGEVTDKELIALAPGSVWFSKRWLEEYFTELGKMCTADGYQIILIGGREDESLCERIGTGIGDDCLNLAGAASLRQTVELLSRCSVLVTNDSAPTHLGSAAGTKVLTIFGSTDERFGFAPYGPNGRHIGIDLYCRPCTDHGKQRCPEKHFRCMKEITPKMVFDELTELLRLN